MPCFPATGQAWVMMILNTEEWISKMQTEDKEKEEEEEEEKEEMEKGKV